MPLYESRKHAENRVDVRPQWRDAVVIGLEAAVAAIVRQITTRTDHSRPLRIAFDGWYDIDWPGINDALRRAANEAGLGLAFRPILNAFRPRDEIAAYKLAFTETDDPGFGVVNADGRITDLMVPGKVSALRDELGAGCAGRGGLPL